MKNTISNYLIIISAIFTILAYIFPQIWILWMNKIFLNSWKYYIYLIQFFTSIFIHAWFIHFLSNSIFLYFFWNLVEIIVWKKRYFLFFIFSIIFIWLWLTYFSNWNTVWISWFCMALISYYTLELKSKKHPDRRGWIVAIIINIWIWLAPWISLVWHLFWAISRVLFYYFNKNYFLRIINRVV
jgi:membrane associated rhomboid family serine protease